jgi:dolichol kinase
MNRRYRENETIRQREEEDREPSFISVGVLVLLYLAGAVFLVLAALLGWLDAAGAIVFTRVGLL